MIMLFRSILRFHCTSFVILFSVTIPALEFEDLKNESIECISKIAIKLDTQDQLTYDLILNTLLATETELTPQQYREKIGNFLESAPILQRVTCLHLDGDTSIGKYFLFYYLKAFPETKYVSIINSNRMTDEELFYLRYANALKFLDVRNCSQVTELFATNLIGLKNLVLVDFVGCTGMHPDSRQQFANHELNAFLTKLQPQQIFGTQFEEKREIFLKNLAIYTVLQFNTSICVQHDQLESEKHLRNFECNLYAMSNGSLKFTETIINLSELMRFTIEFGVINIDARDLADALLANLVSYLPNLQSLNLNNSPVTAGGLWHLRKLPNLHHLSIINTKILLIFQRQYDNKMAINSLFDALQENRNSYADSFLLRKF